MLLMLMGVVVSALWRGEIATDAAGLGSVRWAEDPLRFSLTLAELLARYWWVALVLIGYLAAEIAGIVKKRADQRLALSLERFPPVNIAARLGGRYSGNPPQ